MTIEFNRENFYDSENEAMSLDGFLVFHLPKTLKQIKSSIRDTLSNKEVLERQNEIIPFLELKIKNSTSIYQVARSYLQDVGINKKNFGFTACDLEVDGTTLLGIGSCISYLADNLSILIVVNDLMMPAFDKYRKKFTNGVLGRFKTYDWGNLCFIDYKDLMSTSNDSLQIDLKAINVEFSTILWALPPTSKHQEINQIFISIFKTLDSVAIVNEKFPVDSKKLLSVEKFYKSIGVPLKGILNKKDI